MKLFYVPGACSLASHIIAHELGLELTPVKVDSSKQTSDGRDYLALNPKGYVPALELDDGQILTENTAIVQYLADRKPESGLAPANGTFERYRLQEMLGYINSEIHKSYGPLFSPKATPELHAEKQAYLQKRYPIIEQALEGKSFLFGETFTVADAYLFVVTSWAGFLKVDVSAFKNLKAFQERVAARPAVRAAMAAEGLIKAEA